LQKKLLLPYCQKGEKHVEWKAAQQRGVTHLTLLLKLEEQARGRPRRSKCRTTDWSTRKANNPGANNPGDTFIM